MWYVLFFFLPHDITEYFLLGGPHKYRSPEEFFPHMLWLLNHDQGTYVECICQYCDGKKTQKQINEIFPLPPRKEYPTGPRGPKQKKTGGTQDPKGITYRRVLVQNRNSITTRPATALEYHGQRIIGHGTIHPFQP